MPANGRLDLIRRLKFKRIATEVVLALMYRCNLFLEMLRRAYCFVFSEATDVLFRL